MAVRRQGQRFSVPRGTLRRGRLEFARGAGRLAIRGAGIPELVQARFDRPVPSVSTDGGAVRVRYPLFSLGGWRRPWARRGGEVTLNNDVAWDLDIRGGVAHLDADLRDLRLEGIEVRQGASHVRITTE
jgi:hypothetical protein